MYWMRASAARCTSSGCCCIGAYNIFKTWQTRPAKYEELERRGAPLDGPRRSRRIADAAAALERGIVDAGHWHREWEAPAGAVHRADDGRRDRRVAVRDPSDVPHRLATCRRSRRSSRTRRSSSTAATSTSARVATTATRRWSGRSSTRRDALRRVLEARRVRLRPPVPVGPQAHRSGPRA